MPAFVKTQKDEEHWQHAKRIALRALHNKSPSSEEHDNDTLSKGKSWGFVTDRYKKLKSGKIKKRSIEESLFLGCLVKKISSLG